MKQQYDSYKPSGIDWIGEIPSHWKVVPIKQLCRAEKYSVKTGPFGSQLKGEDLKPEGDVIVYNQRNVIDNNFDDAQFFVSKQKAEELESFVTIPNDILVTSRGTIGRAAILSSENKMGILHPCLIALRINYSKANLKWIVRWINDSDAFQKEIDSKSNATTIDVIYSDTIKNIRICLPPLAEQEAIAVWLDEKCGEIDAAIAKVDREIELIDELKQSEISRVVTRGLNPNVKLRPSSIDWIGEIPSHWDVIKFSHAISKIADIDHYMPNSVEKGYPYLMIGDLMENCSEIDMHNCKQIAKTDYINLSKKIRPHKGDLILARYASIGTVSYVDIESEFVVSYGCLTIQTRKDFMNSKYLFHVIKSHEFFNECNQYINSNTQGNLGLDSLSKTKIIFPPLAEQCEIADYLDKKCAEIDGLKSKLKKKRDTLVELRQAMISEVVTGKRKVV